MSTTIFLYNPVSGHGHLDSWQAMFAVVLAERGYAVTCLTDNPEELQRHLTSFASLQRGQAVLPPIYVRALGFKKTLRNRVLRGIVWWTIFSDRYVRRTEEAQICEDMSALTKLKKRLFQRVVPLVRMALGNLSGLRTWCHDGMYLARFHQHLLKAIDEAKGRPDIVLHMYLDWEKHAQLHKVPFPCAWAGIRFVPSADASEPCYAMPSFRGMAFCDEMATTAHRAQHPDKQFVTLPDITNAALPEATPPLVDEIVRRAAGRTIVFMGGSIGPQKNVCAWKACVDRMNPAEWFFVQVGEIHFETLDSASKESMHALLTSPPEHFLAYTGYLPDETLFNAIINASDIIFAAYKNFTISSNMPGKAAAFGKPILVSMGDVMGKRVTDYGIGLAVPQNDVESMTAALTTLRSHPIDATHFAAYRHDFSYEKMGSMLDAFVHACVTERKVAAPLNSHKINTASSTE